MFSQPSHLILFLVEWLWVVGDLLLSFVMRSRIGPLIVLLPIAIGSPLCKMSMRPLRIKSNAIVLVNCICIACGMCKYRKAAWIGCTDKEKWKTTYMLPPRVSVKQRTRNFARSARFLNPSGGQHIKHLCLNDGPKAGDTIVFITLRLSRVCIFILHDTAYTRSEYILGQGIFQKKEKRKMNDAQFGRQMHTEMQDPLRMAIIRGIWWPNSAAAGPSCRRLQMTRQFPLFSH